MSAQPGAAEFSKNSGSEAAHLLAFRAPDLESEGDAGPDHVLPVDEDGNLPAPPPERIGKEAFYEVFKIGFSAPGMVIKDLRPLAIQPDEEEPARAASDAIHSLLEIYYPGALTPQSETLAHLMAAAPFLIGKALIVREIMRAPRARVVNATNDTQSDDHSSTAEPPSVFDNWHIPGQEVPS